MKGAYNTGFRPYSSFDIDNKGGRDEVLFKFDTKNETTLTVILSPELEFDEVCDLGKGALLSLTMGNLPIAVFLQPYFTISGEASVGANLGVTLNEYNTYQVAKQGLLPKITRLKERFELELLGDLSSKISGDFFVGLGLRVDFRIFGRKDLSVGVGPEFGFHAVGEVGAYLIEGNETATSDYEALEENHVALSGKAQLSGYVDATFFKEVKEPWHETLAEFTFFEQCYYLLPSFYNTRYESNSGQIEARTTVGRDLLFETKVGIAAYRDGKVQHYGQGYSYHFARDFYDSNPICESFNEEPGVEYWTYIKLGNDYVKGVLLDDDSLRKILIKFYQDTDGDNWTSNYGWCTEWPIDGWEGVKIVRDSISGKVSHLDLFLSGYNVAGHGDLSGCEALRSISITGNPIESLNLSDCINLIGNTPYDRGLEIRDNPNLESLDVSGCTSLDVLVCYNDALTSLDVSGSAIKDLGCWDCPLTSLDLSGCTSLETLACVNIPLTSLDISDCTSLKTLNCYNTYIPSLDLSEHPSLDVLWCVLNPLLASIDASACVDLWAFSCNQNNQLTTVNLSGCTALADIKVSDNPQLATINLSGCTAITELSSFDISNNPRLESLNLSGCTALETGVSTFVVAHPQLTAVDLSGCTKLKSLGFSDTQLASLDVSSCTALYSLDCGDNQLTSLNVAGCTALQSLYCDGNQLTSLHAEGCTALRVLDCRHNPMTQVISAFYQSIPSFSCDKRYTYFTREVKIGDEYITRYYWKYNYANHHGWYYPDEPKSGYMYAGN